jgi:hypothetical protein
MITEQLQEAIRNSGVTRYRISQGTGIDQATLCHFMQGRSSLSFASADKILDVLGLEIVIRPRRARKGE